MEVTKRGMKQNKNKWNEKKKMFERENDEE